MPVLRHRHAKDFTVVPNGIFRDNNLSLKAIGMLCYLLHLPDGWEFSVAGLEKILSNDGRDSIRRSLEEISTAGYLKRAQSRDKHGRLAANEWLISDMPEFLSTDKPPAERPLTGNPPAETPSADHPSTENQRQSNTIPTKYPIKERTHQESTPACKSFGQYGWVRLSDREYAKLLQDFGQAELNRCIAYIDESAQSTGNKNKWRDWNLVLRRCHRDRWGLGTAANKSDARDRVRTAADYEGGESFV